MEKIKNILRPGGDKDDEVMYGTPSKVSEQPPQLQTDEGKEGSGGILRQVLNPGGAKYSEESYGTTAHAVDDTQKSSDLPSTTTTTQEESKATSSAAPGTRLSTLQKEDLDDASVLSIKSGKEGPYAQGADTPVLEQSGLSYAETGTAAGGATAAGAAAHEGIVRENKGDDVSSATYTARSYPLTDRSVGPSESKEPVVDSSEDRREPEENSSNTARDTSLAGAGTLIGAGAVSAGALAAQEDKHNAADVEQATYTDRAYPVGSSGAQEGATPISANAQDINNPEKLDSSNRLAPHVPGEFPTESGEDPHVPGQFPADSSEKEQYGIGTGSAVAGAMGLTVGGAAAGTAAANSSSDDTSKATERDLHPGGSGFPHESSQPTESGSDSNKGVIGGALAAVGLGSAGAATYAATRGDDSKGETESPRDVGRDQAQSLKTKEPGSPEVNSSRPPETATESETAKEEDKSDSNKGVIGAAAAAVGLGGAGTYLATRDSKDEKEWPESPKDVGRDHARNLSIKEPGSPEVNPSRPSESTKTDEVAVPQQATKDDVAKEEESHTGRNTALAGGAAAAAGGAAYYATRDHDDKQEPPKEDPAREQAKNLTTKEPGTEEKNPSTVPVPSQATKDDVAQKEEEDESHTGRNAALAGGAAAAAGGAAYYATRDDEQPQQEEEKKGVLEKAKEKVTGDDDKKAEKEREKEAEKARKEQEKQRKEQEKAEEKRQKEAAKEEEKRQKEAAKEEEKRKKEAEKEEEKRKAAAAKEEEKRKKEAEKEEEKRRKEAEKAEKDEEKRRAAAAAEEEKRQKQEEEESHTGRDAAIAGGAATAAGAGAAYAATRDDEEGESHLSKKEEERKKKEEWEKLNMERLAAYNRGELGPEDVLKDREKAIAKESESGPHTAEEAVLAGGAGATAAALAKGEEPPPKPSHEQEQKKPGFIQKILHPRKSRQEERERRASQDASRSSQDSHPRHVGTDGPIGDDNKVSGLESESSAKGTTASSTQAPSSTARTGDDEIRPIESGSQPSTRELQAGEQAPEGFITIHHAGASEDAPHLVVQDK